ncbi:MAG: hypothetical protein KF859_07705 [Phycisphaeraceae bacterium]|nr:hypothetical protein [Phycisphaeraceae bacterium]
MIRARFHRLRSAAMFAASLIFVAGHPLAAPADITWNFDNNEEGWIITDHPCTSPYLYIASVYGVEWLPTGGDPGGFIQRLDPSRNCFFFTAPQSAMGDWSQYIGGTLSFSMRSSHNNANTDTVIVISNVFGATLFAAVDPLPVPTWRRYIIPLVASSFRHNSANGAPASDWDMYNVLSTLTTLRIPGEFGSGTIELVGLDSVSVTRACDCACFDCAADFNQDGGVDGADVEAFYDAWEAGACDADVNLDGGIDGGDVEFFFGLWEAGGCE